MPTLREFCKEKGINYSALAEYHFNHQDLTIQEVIEHFLLKKQPNTKVQQLRQPQVTSHNNTSKPTSFKQKCSLAGIKYNTAASYKRRHKELTDEQVIQYYLTNKKER